jgi:hypothetical protein
VDSKILRCQELQYHSSRKPPEANLSELSDWAEVSESFDLEFFSENLRLKGKAKSVFG